jgi:ElaB/YqjD/DUF883 family membrane-anchored ribosome-binding protein
MQTVTDVAEVAGAIKQRLGSGLQQFEEKVEQGRRVITRGRHAAEDGVAAAVLQVRRHPLRTVAAATAAGALVGCVVGFACGRWARR